MKTGIFAGKKTAELISWLEANFPKEIVLFILFPEEVLEPLDLDLVILDETQAAYLPSLVSLINPPQVAIIGQGTSRDNLHYLSDFSKEFPNLLKNLTPRDPTVTFVKGNQKFVYRQKDIVAVIDDAGVDVYLRSGNKIVPSEGVRRVCSQLSPDLFFRVTSKMMANILYVSQMESDAVLMENGLRLPFSPAEKQAVENAFYKIKFHENQPARKKRTASRKKKKEI